MIVVQLWEFGKDGFMPSSVILQAVSKAYNHEEALDIFLLGVGLTGNLYGAVEHARTLEVVPPFLPRNREGSGKIWEDDRLLQSYNATWRFGLGDTESGEKNGWCVLPSCLYFLVMFAKCRFVRGSRQEQACHNHNHMLQKLFCSLPPVMCNVHPMDSRKFACKNGL